MTTALRRQFRAPRLPVWRPTHSSLLTAVAVLTLAVPFAIIILRLLAETHHVYLADDLALIDLHVRDAVHWHQQLGPFDRFGWSHPGPVYFYLLSIPARLLGTGARADFVGATLINAVSALGTIWVVRRRSGPAAALWGALCLGLMAFVLASTSPGATTFSEGPLGALVTPWNPDVVIFPLVLFGALCAAGAKGSPLSLLGAALAGSFAVQTNIATLPLVGVLLILALAAALVRTMLARRSTPGTRPPRQSPARARTLVAGLILLPLIWVPPVVEQFTNHPGNLTLIWQFFTAHHPALTLGTGLWSVVTVAGIIPLGVPSEMSVFLGNPTRDAGVILAVVLLVGAVTIAMGLVRRRRFAANLGIASLIGFVVVLLSVTRIVGGVYGYLIVWEIAVPTLALMGLGIALFGTGDEEVQLEATALPRWARRLPALALVALAGVVTVALSIEMLHVPSLQRASDPDVAAVWRTVGPRLGAGDKPILVTNVGTDAGGSTPGALQWQNLPAEFTRFGLVNELDARGFQPRVDPFWSAQVGARRVSNGREPVRIVLYPSSSSVEHMSGYVGRAGRLDIVILRTAPSR